MLIPRAQINPLSLKTGKTLTTQNDLVRHKTKYVFSLPAERKICGDENLNIKSF